MYRRRPNYRWMGDKKVAGLQQFDVTQYRQKLKGLGPYAQSNLT